MPQPMRWILASLLLLLGLVALGGCAADAPAGNRLTGHGREPSAMLDWVAGQGGVVEDARATRATQLLDALNARTVHRSLRVHVLATQEIVAYSWPRGDIFVSAGLMDACSDREATAAIAHEMGHLINDGHLKAPAAITGHAGGEIETGADLTACDLLAQCGIPQTALVSTLEHVRATATSAVCRYEMQRRIAAIRHYAHLRD